MKRRRRGDLIWLQEGDGRQLRRTQGSIEDSLFLPKSSPFFFFSFAFVAVTAAAGPGHPTVLKASLGCKKGAMLVSVLLAAQRICAYKKGISIN